LVVVRLGRVRGVDDLADPGREVRERHELRSGPAPGVGDAGAAAVPLPLESGQGLLRCLGVERGVDGLQAGGDGLAVAVAGVADAVADQVKPSRNNVLLLNSQLVDGICACPTRCRVS
jgi:hypothetical protein